LSKHAKLICNRYYIVGKGIWLVKGNITISNIVSQGEDIPKDTSQSYNLGITRLGDSIIL
jgi:hypothetical protein